MQYWDEITRFALLGTDRSVLSAQLKAYFSEYKIAPQQTENVQLLEAAAIFGVLQKAIIPTKEVSLEGTTSAPITPTEKYISPNASRLLTHILHTAYDGVLEEFLVYTHRYQKVLPPAFLPEILNCCLRSTTLWQYAQPVIGNRGVWLLEQHPQWKHLQSHRFDFNWQTADADAKVKHLRAWRQHDPAEGLALLEHHWMDEDHRTQVKLIKTLAISLSLADEFFLENSLDAKRVTIRQEAAQLLAKLEGSAYIDRMTQRAKQCLQLKTSSEKGLKMVVQPWETIQATDTRDGLSHKMEWQRKKGAWGMTYYLLQCVPLPYLEKHFNVTQAELLESYVRSEQATLLLQSAIDTAITFENKAWTDALFRYWIENAHKSRWQALDTSLLIQNVHTATFNRSLTKLLREAKGTPMDDSSVLYTLLQVSEHRWDAKTAKAFIELLEYIALDNQYSHWGLTQVKNSIKNAAYCCPPDQYDVLQRLLPPAKMRFTIWEEDHHRFLKIMRFRRDMVQALQAD